MSRTLRLLIVLGLTLLATACEKDYDYDDDRGPPVLTIGSPGSGASVCATLEASFTATGSRAQLAFTCAIDDGAFEPCTSPLTSFEDLAAGPHTLTVTASNDVGSDQASVDFEVDGLAPILELTPSAGAVNSGTGVLQIDLLGDADWTSVEAGLELRDGDGQSTRVPGSCTCVELRCECTGLAAGENWLSARVTDTCGNVSPWSSTNVTASFGPYRGHAVLIGHDYSADATPDVLGNAAALVPFLVDDLDIGRDAVRVVAWRPAGVPDDVVTRATGSLTTVLTAAGATFDAATDYVEIADPADLPAYLAGRDVLVMYEPGEAYDEEQLGAIADGFAPVLDRFTTAGGVAIALHSSRGWQLLDGGAAPLIDLEGGYPLGADDGGGGFEPNYLLTRYPASALGTAGYPLLDGVEAEYPTPAGSGCATVVDPAATVLVQHIGGNCGDGCSYYACDAIVDQRMPRFTIAVTPTVDVDPYPACVPDAIGLDSVGGFAVTVADGLPTPTGTFVCTHAPSPGYLTDPAPIEGCTVTSQAGGSYAVTLASAPRTSVEIDITLVDGGVPVRSGRGSFRVDGDLFVNVSDVAANACAGGYLIREYPPNLTPECAATVPDLLALAAVTCTLERETSPGVFVQVASHSGTGCGAVASAGGGFESNSYTVDWSADIVAAGASGNLRHTITATDYHGNTATGLDTWTLSSATLCN